MIHFLQNSYYIFLAVKTKIEDIELSQADTTTANVTNVIMRSQC